MHENDLESVTVFRPRITLILCTVSSHLDGPDHERNTASVPQDRAQSGNTAKPA